MIVFRQADPRYPFLWSDASQPPARWHGEGEGPVHYLADTPDGAWAELLRHEEIEDPDDAATLRRALWAIDIGDDAPRPVNLPMSALTGGIDTYRTCQEYARRVRARGARRIVAPSAALVPGGAAGRQVSGGVERSPEAQTGRVIVIFDRPDGLIGWRAVERGAPPPDLLPRVRHQRPRGAARRRE